MDIHIVLTAKLRAWFITFATVKQEFDLPILPKVFPAELKKYLKTPNLDWSKSGIRLQVTLQ